MTEPMATLEEKLYALIRAARLQGRLDVRSNILSDRLEADRTVRVARDDLLDHLSRHHRMANNYHLGEE